MPKAYKVRKRTMYVGERKGETLYNVTPVSFGILTTEDAAKQIAEESAATPGDVKAVLDRYAHYVVENLKKGYSIELLGFGNLYLRFITARSVSDQSKANASLVRSLVPGFRPSFTIGNNYVRQYALIPDKITLVNYDKFTAGADSAVEEEMPGESDNGTGGTSGSGSTSGSGTTGTGSTNTDNPFA